jgi:hypothetical protein
MLQEAQGQERSEIQRMLDAMETQIGKYVFNDRLETVNDLFLELLVECKL